MRYTGIKGRAWKATREYVCERDGWKCSTCHRSRAGGFQMQAGHYHPVGLVGSNNTLSWDEMNIHCQCSYCNGVGQGMQARMKQYITRKYGAKVVKELDARVHKIDPVKDWQGLIDHYKEKLKQLLS